MELESRRAAKRVNQERNVISVTNGDTTRSYARDLYDYTRSGPVRLGET